MSNTLTTLADVLQHSRTASSQDAEPQMAADYDAYPCIKHVLNGIEEARGLEETLMHRYDVDGDLADPDEYRKHKGYYHNKVRLLMCLYENWNTFRSVTISAVDAGHSTADYTPLTKIKGIGPFSVDFIARLYQDCVSKRAELQRVERSIDKSASRTAELYEKRSKRKGTASEPPETSVERRRRKYEMKEEADARMAAHKAQASARSAKQKRAAFRSLKVDVPNDERPPNHPRGAYLNERRAEASEPNANGSEEYETDDENEW